MDSSTNPTQDSIVEDFLVFGEDCGKEESEEQLVVDVKDNLSRNCTRRSNRIKRKQKPWDQLNNNLDNNNFNPSEIESEMALPAPRNYLIPNQIYPMFSEISSKKIVHTCAICLMTFSKIFSLKRHNMLHTGESQQLILRPSSKGNLLFLRRTTLPVRAL